MCLIQSAGLARGGKAPHLDRCNRIIEVCATLSPRVWTRFGGTLLLTSLYADESTEPGYLANSG